MQHNSLKKEKKEAGQSSYELQVKNFKSLYKAIKLH